MRDIAFVDTETTGLDPARHEIIEIGVIRVSGDTLGDIDSTDVRVRLERMEDADPEALRLNGYTKSAWENAASLREALDWIAPLLEDTMLAGHNVSFDRAFLDAAWKRAGFEPPSMDYHVLDTVSLAWPLFTSGAITSLSLEAVCRHLGIDLKEPHRALADAERSLDIARRLLPRARLAAFIGALEADEVSLVEALLGRLHAGRSEYGPWRLRGDKRHYPREALHEVLDSLSYCAAQLMRMERPETETRP